MTEPEDRTVYSGMTLKQKRTIEGDVESLFTPTAFIPKPTWEEIKRLDFFHPSVKINRGTLFPSDKGVAALTRLTDLLCGIRALSEFVSKREISNLDLPLSSESVAHLTKVCFLKQLASLPDLQDRSEIQNAIIRSIYWFADAYGDRNPTMQFVKLWSCAECFFAIDKEGVTDLNAKGFAAILTFAGFRIIDVKDYPDFKRRIKNLYGSRSEAIHRASFGHIQTSDLDDLSHWIAWIIISMVALSQRGYRTLRQVQEQTSRLDRLTDATDTPVGST